MSKPHVAFLGLGNMGSGMAQRLISANFPVTVYNRNPQRSQPFARTARVSASPRQAASGADIVISMVADNAASKAMWMGQDGALCSVAKNAVLIESGTLTVGWIQELAAATRAKQCELLDAPVTGSKTHAAAGELVFLVGGPEKALEKARPVLSAMSKNIIHLGPNGSGVLMKLVNNFMVGVQVASFAEALAVVYASGLDHDKAVSILNHGAPGSPIIKRISETIASREVTPNFVLRLMAKDLNYATAEAELYGVNFRTAPAALEVFVEAIAKGLGEEDFSEVIKSFP